jgi:hypothetical protein
LIFWVFEGKAEKLLFRRELLGLVFWGRIPGPSNFPKDFPKVNRKLSKSLQIFPKNLLKIFLEKCPEKLREKLF